MSDCSVNAWRVPAEREPGVIYQHGMYDAAMIEHVSAIEVEGVRFERARTCEMEYVSDFMSWHCKACDMMDMAPRDPKPRFCKWCGAKVVGE